jgi:hypothetical protein
METEAVQVLLLSAATHSRNVQPTMKANKIQNVNDTFPLIAMIL